MFFKYWVEFDENGDIIALHKDKRNCPMCEEFIVKLIPITRSEYIMNDDQKLDELISVVEAKTIKFSMELDKLDKTIKRMGGKI